MSKGINKVILVGYVGQNPEVKQLTNGGTLANISLATSDKWKDKETGEKKERTEWHKVVFFNKLAEIVGQYVVKGSQLYVEGRLQTRQWDDQDGNKRYTTEIIANEMQMLSSRDSAAKPIGGAVGYQGVASVQPSLPVATDFDDDVPF